MAQTVEYWQNIIIDQLAANNILVSGSRTSVRRIWTYVVAYAMWLLDKLFDLHRTEVESILAEKKPHRLRWYRNKALDFQLGYDLVNDSDVYDNSGLTDEQIAESKIIKYSAVVELTLESRLIVKIATEVNGVLQPISLMQRNAFAAYMAEVKDGGVNLTVINYLPDLLYLDLEIYFDPLVLDDQGNSILSGGKPVEAAILEYMMELPFNGELVLVHLIDKLQKVAGVAIPNLVQAQSRWIDGQTNDYGAIQTIAIKKIPESGYFQVVDFNNVTYIPNA